MKVQDNHAFTPSVIGTVYYCSDLEELGKIIQIMQWVKTPSILLRLQGIKSHLPRSPSPTSSKRSQALK
ncbi:hypothetical protein HYFRA_00001281 [Hymenoscyphus fraxineus]|uniref:Uncharacterized protein n=1 Tax=Hymenoscyphus fraxineus TaxID=746836 RepID=A0A9N9L7C9_9HELO|nr:hypothetical protein HYFRA_00001281 [Hymenoscyphus fraxineus]